MPQSTTTPTATVRLGGQDRTVEFTLEVLSRIEERTGLGVFECAQEIDRCCVDVAGEPGKRRFEFRRAKVAFMAALIAGALDVSVEEVQGLLKGRGVVRTFGGLMNEFLSAVYDLMSAEEDEDAHPPAAEAPVEGASATSTPGDASSST